MTLIIEYFRLLSIDANVILIWLHLVCFFYYFIKKVAMTIVCRCRCEFAPPSFRHQHGRSD